jgi:hypothetical protein
MINVSNGVNISISSVAKDNLGINNTLTPFLIIVLYIHLLGSGSEL